MNYINLQSLDDLITYYPHLCVGGKFYNIQSSLIGPAFPATYTQYNRHGVVVDESTGRAWFREEIFAAILQNSQSPGCTVDENHLGLGMLVPFTGQKCYPSDHYDSYPSLIFRNNFRHNASEWIETTIANSISSPIELDLQLIGTDQTRQAKATALVLGGAELEGGTQILNRMEERIDPEPVFEGELSFKYRQRTWHEYVITLVPRLPQNFLDLGIRSFVIDPGETLQNMLSHCMAEVASFTIAELWDKASYTAEMVARVWGGSQRFPIMLHLYDGNIYQGMDDVYPGWFGFAHLHRSVIRGNKLHVPFQANAEKMIDVPIPEEGPDYLYQVKSPISHSNGIGTVGDLLVPVARMPKNDRSV